MDRTRPRAGSPKRHLPFKNYGRSRLLSTVLHQIRSLEITSNSRDPSKKDLPFEEETFWDRVEVCSPHTCEAAGFELVNVLNVSAVSTGDGRDHHHIDAPSITPDVRSHYPRQQ